MRRTIIACLLLSLVPGCNRAERRSLTQFLDAVAASIGHRYDDQLQGIANPERNVRFRVLFARDQLAAVDAYLATQPPIGAAARQAVDGYRAAKAGELELYEKLLAEKRYEPSETEKRRDAELLNEAQRRLDAIGRIVDG